MTPLHLTANVKPLLLPIKVASTAIIYKTSTRIHLHEITDTVFPAWHMQSQNKHRFYMLAASTERPSSRKCMKHGERMERCGARQWEVTLNYLESREGGPGS